MKRFIFVRHGESEANAALIIATDDARLTELGREQARLTALEVKKLGIKAVVCSPLLRAQQTAEIIAGELGIPLAKIKVIEELRERDAGELKGKPKTNDSAWYILNDTEYGFESRAELIKRMTCCLARLKELVEKEGTVLAVGHAASGFYLLQVAKGHTQFEDFDPPEQMVNADFVAVNIA